MKTEPPDNEEHSTDVGYQRSGRWLPTVKCFGLTLLMLAAGLASGSAASGDTFRIAPDLVNMRAAPTGEATVRDRLTSGTEVIELRRDDGWYGVRVIETGQEGWIYGELLRAVSTSALGDKAGAGIFVGLSADFDRLMSSLEQATGSVMVDNINDAGDTLEITINPNWLRTGSADEHILLAASVFQMWKNHRNQAPVKVLLLGESDEPYLTIEDTGEQGLQIESTIVSPNPGSGG